jgi:hypothetical protein
MLSRRGCLESLVRQVAANAGIRDSHPVNIQALTSRTRADPGANRSSVGRRPGPVHADAVGFEALNKSALTGVEDAKKSMGFRLSDEKAFS